MSQVDITNNMDDIAALLLQDEIRTILLGSDFSFSGAFCYASVLSNPPNPCLNIEGLGIIGLPLGERDAKAIIAYARSTQTAPFDHVDHAASDGDVQHRWEIEASKISFVNPEWENYVKNPLCSTLCECLGVINGANVHIAPKMELHGLILCGIGSELLSNQKSTEVDGVFATAIISLPSAYTGGQITLSLASRTETFEYSSFSTSLLGWYNNVIQEVKPIESGYRLALCYKMCHPPQEGIPRPRIPNMEQPIYQLQQVLQGWNRRQNPPRFITCLLDHCYPVDDLIQGAKILKGADLHRVTFIQPVAEQSGFQVCLAALDHKIAGRTDNYGHNYFMTPRYRVNNQASDQGTPKIRRVTSTSTTISSLLDLKDLSILSAGKIIVSQDSLIPSNPFNKDITPDKAKYRDDYDLDYWYHRSCLVLIRKEDVDDILYISEGAPYVIRMVKKSVDNPPTLYHRQWVGRLLQEEKSIVAEHVRTLLDLSTNWKDIQIWNAVINHESCTLSTLNLGIVKNSMEKFGFDALRSSFEILLGRSDIFVKKIVLLTKLPSQSSANEKDIVTAWSQGEISKIVASYATFDIEDIPAIIRSFREEDVNGILIRYLEKEEESYAFCIAFVKTLLQNRQSVVERNSSSATPLGINTDSKTEPDRPHLALIPTSGNHSNINDLIRRCLQAAVPQWKFHKEAHYSWLTRDTRVDRVVEILEYALAFGDLDICRRLFVDILRYQESAEDKSKAIYVPLIPRLRTLLEAKGQSFFQQPFAGFIQVVIALYLRDVLRQRGNIASVNLRKIGCGCEDCEKLDSDIMSTYRDRDYIMISVPRARRLHLESRLKDATDLCTYRIDKGSPCSIILTRFPAVIEALEWRSRQKDAKAFLASIGSDNDISHIMGSRYTDVKCAVDGLRPFGSFITNIPVGAVGTGSSTASTTAEPSTSTFTTRISTTTSTSSGISAQSSTQAQGVSIANALSISSSSIDGVARLASETDFSEQSAVKKRKLSSNSE